MESIKIIINSGVPYQFRTTGVKEYCSMDDLSEIRLLLGNAKHYLLQPFVSQSSLIDDRLNEQSQYSPVQIEHLKAVFDR